MCACGVQFFSVNLARSVVAGAVYFRKCRLCPGAECDESSARKADAGSKCGEFVVLLKYIGCGRQLWLRILNLVYSNGSFVVYPCFAILKNIQ